MNAISERLFDWLLRSSWQAAILVLVILGVQWVFGKRLGPYWRAALWLLVILKLILPSAPQSAFSLFNLASWRIGERPRIASSPGGVNSDQSTAIAMDLHGSSKVSAMAEKGNVSSAARTIAWAIWITGAVLLGARMTWQALSSSALLKGAPKVKDPAVLNTFESAKRLLGVKSATLIQTDLVASPAVYGYFSPKVLLPGHMSCGFSAQELRHVFLHELAHVKRQDMLILWVVSVLKTLHWFNPVLWFGFRRLAADRELACDELALSYAEEGERRSYGETILRLLQVCAGRPKAIGTAGILENRSQVLQRISMIANFHKRSQWSFPSLLLIGILGLVTLTEARQQSQETLPDKDQPNALSKSSSDEYQVQSALSQARVPVAGQDDSGPPLQPDGLQSDSTREKPDKASSNLPYKLDAERADRQFAVDPEQRRDLKSLRDEIESLEKRRADLEREIKAQEARVNANRSATTEQEFRKRFGLSRTDVPSEGTNTPTSEDLARAQAHNAFLRRYGLDPSRLPTPAPASTNSSQEARARQQARDAFMRRYGLTQPNEVSSGDPFRPATAIAPRTAMSPENLPLRVAIDANGVLRFGNEGKQMGLDEVRAKLGEEAKLNPSLKLSIIADKKAPFGTIIKVMDAAKDASVKSVNAFAEDFESRSESR